MYALGVFSKKSGYDNINITVSIQVVNIWKGHEWSVPRKTSQDGVRLASALLKCDVQWKKGYTQWQICVTARGWHGLTNPSKLRGLYALANWLSVLIFWILRDWGKRTKITGGRSVWESRIKSDIILGFTRNTCLMVNIKNPKLGVCITMVLWSQRMQKFNEFKRA